MAKFKLLALLALACTTAPAIAASEPKSVKVDYSDLNLSTEAGQKKLARRVSSASQMVCDSLRTGTRMMSQEMRDCKANAEKQTEEIIARYNDGSKVIAGN